VIKIGKRNFQMPGVIERASLHAQIVEHLGAQIVGISHEAEILPPEPMLAAELGVSRNALREAIKVLAGKGLVEVRTRTGTRVRPRVEWNLLDPDILRWSGAAKGNLTHAMSIVEFRRIIEPKAAVLAARRGTAAELQEIERTCSQLEACLNMQLEQMSEFDIAFHSSILLATHNEILIYLGSLVASLMKVQVVATTKSVGVLAVGLRQHRALADAILARDADLAEILAIELVNDPYGVLAAEIGMPPAERLT
jgi:GntR family transcriptional regulator, galactonate operon transcriptional repressor